MRITIEIEQSVEAALAKQAAAAGITLESYASRILAREVEPNEKLLHPKVQRSLEMPRPFRGKIGPIPDGALRAELLYGEK